MGDSPLRDLLETTAAVEGVPMKDLTVLAPQNDPFRVDTPAGHRDGAWLADQITELGLAGRTIHLRGLHYAVIGRPKPDGTPYTNTDDDWTWLHGKAAKAARWLRYVPFESIVDQRNAQPEVIIHERPYPRGYVLVGLEVEIPDVDDLVPRVGVRDFVGVQPYKIVMVGEKASLAEVLGPIAQQYDADLYLPTGEISDTLVHRMAVTGAEDGRPMVALYFADCDPSGHQMGISLARKLQAFSAFGDEPVSGQCRHDGHGGVERITFGDLDWRVNRVALTPDQVREYGLPSTPLKATERRADRWREATGVAQTEIDALASLQPDLLRQLATEAIHGFYDRSLGRRVQQARRAWLDAAQARLDEGLDHDQLERLRADAAERLATMRDEIDAINAALQVDVDPGDFPEIEIPEPEGIAGEYGLPLVDSGWSFAEQCRRLIDSKRYRT
jgi:hypothetical protein